MKTLKRFLTQLAIILAIPLVVFAARTATPTVSSLFPSNLLYVNFAPPVVSLPTAPGAGSLTAGGTLFFYVTALDGQGESTGGNVVGTTTLAAGSEGLQLTWPAVTGATSYRVYFSTSTPLTLTQFFTGTSTSNVPNPYYTFTSTSTPTYSPTGVPTSNAAYGVKLNSTGSSYFLGGNVGIATSSPWAPLSVAGCQTNIACFVLSSIQGQNAEMWIFQSGQSNTKFKAQDLQFRQTFNNPYEWDSDDVGTNVMTMSGQAQLTTVELSNSLGIGTTSPQVHLDVVGQIRAESVSTSTCNAIIDGAIFYNQKDKHAYICISTVWQLIK